MLRLRLFVAIIVAMVAVNVVAFVSCTREMPTEPSSAPAIGLDIIPLPDRDSSGVAQEWYVQTSEQFDSVMDKNIVPYLITGDTVRLKADTLFNLGTKAYPSLDSMSLLIVGDSPAPTVKSSNTVTNSWALRFNAAGLSSRLVFRNIKFDGTGIDDSVRFLHAFNFADVLLDNVDADLGHSLLFLHGDSVVVKDCLIESQLTALDLGKRALNGTNPNYVLDNTAVFLQTVGSGQKSVYARFTSVAGKIVIKDSDVHQASSSKNYLLRCFTQSSGDLTVTVDIQDNAFDDDVALIFDGLELSEDSITYNLTYENNSWPSDHCPPAVETAGGVTLVADEMQWLWNNAEVSYSYIWTDIGKVEDVAHTKKYCDDTHWVVAGFDLVADTLDNHHAFTTPVVKYGFSTGSRPYTAIVCWNAGYDKWLVEMDVDACTSKTCTVYWDATVTLCDSTGTSAEQSHTYQRVTGPCKDPLVCD